MKLYSDEAGSDLVRSLPVAVVSSLLRVEVTAALWAKRRAERLADVSIRSLIGEFEADYYGDGRRPPRFLVVAANDGVLDVAAGLAGAHGLRAYDAVQLASAVAARAADPNCTSFACFDTALAEAAQNEGFTVIPAA